MLLVTLLIAGWACRPSVRQILCRCWVMSWKAPVLCCYFGGACHAKISANLQIITNVSTGWVIFDARTQRQQPSSTRSHRVRTGINMHRGGPDWNVMLVGCVKKWWKRLFSSLRDARLASSQRVIIRWLGVSTCWVNHYLFRTGPTWWTLNIYWPPDEIRQEITPRT